jgi:hypothetical protein
MSDSTVTNTVANAAILKYGSNNHSTTITIILALLGVIVVIMIYNYWIVYTYCPNSSAESFSSCVPCNKNIDIPQDLFNNNNKPSDRSNYTLSDLDHLGKSTHETNKTHGVNTLDLDPIGRTDRSYRTDRLSDKELSPTVAATIQYVTQYKEGKMNSELKKYYEEYNKQLRDQISYNHVNRSPHNRMKEMKDSVNSTNIVNNKQQSPQSPQQTQPSQQHLSKPQLSQPQNSQKNTTNNPVKVIIYHMDGCGHCSDIMTRVQSNNKTRFQTLKDTFSKYPNVSIIDYKYGRDKEADRFNSFPVVMIVTNEGETEYNGPRDVNNIAKAVVKTMMNN